MIYLHFVRRSAKHFKKVAAIGPPNNLMHSNY